MYNELIFGSIIVLVAIVAIYLFYWQKEKKLYQNKSKNIPSAESVTVNQANQQSIKSNPSVLPLQLQAYERLVILTERIALPNLISRIQPEDLDAKNYEMLLIQQIKTEYEYNLSQQLYVSNEAWQAVTGLKDQNIFIVNQIASGFQPGNSAKEMVQMIHTLLNTDTKVSMHTIVLEALQFDVKKLMSQSV